MADTIYTIPINNAFQQEECCPFCTLRKKLESETVAYVLGPAVMEPDVREATNRLGFCQKHYHVLMDEKNRLALALILESHLQKLADGLAGGRERRGLFGGKGSAPQSCLRSTADHSCYICSRMEIMKKRVISNTIHLWKTDRAFQEKFDKRRDYCLPHIAALLDAGGGELGSGQYTDFSQSLTAAAMDELQRLAGDIEGFAGSFDYRRQGHALSDSKRHAIENTVSFLTGY